MKETHNSGASTPPSTNQLTRIERVLEYIHSHIDHPLSVELLAEKSCWSRWQLQRVFLHETQQTVAHYVRELKLSLAAEQLLSSSERIVDIALNSGFNSEVSFTRAFKQFFSCSPSHYRKRGQRIGLKTPLKATLPIYQAHEIKKRLLQIRVERKEGFYLYGTKGEINGLFSHDPNYTQAVPQIWQQFIDQTGLRPPFDIATYGVIDTRDINEANPVPYWAGYSVSKNEAQRLPQEQILFVPEQEYAVIPYTGPINELDKTLEWFLGAWLPESKYRGIEGFEIEIYTVAFDYTSAEAQMEYWLPIELAR